MNVVINIKTNFIAFGSNLTEILPFLSFFHHLLIFAMLMMRSRSRGCVRELLFLYLPAIYEFQVQFIVLGIPIIISLGFIIDIFCGDVILSSNN